MQRARAAGGALRAGGDAPNQMDWLKTAFESRFPGVTLDVTVDLSKFHDLCIDQELAAGTLTPDVAMLQTTFDFDKWKARDVLLRATSRSASPGRRKATPIPTAPMSRPTTTPSCRPSLPSGCQRSAIRTRFADYLKPAFKGKLVPTYPTMTMRCCTSRQAGTALRQRFPRALAAQKPNFLRGTAAPAASVGTDSIGSLGNLDRLCDRQRYAGRLLHPDRRAVPSSGTSAAISRPPVIRPRPALLLSYLARPEFHPATAAGAPARRRRSARPPPLESLKNVDVHDFTRWMADRQRVVSLRRHWRKSRPVRGESPLRDPALMSLLGLTANDIVALPEPDPPIY
ncbi:hypothetical protein ACPA9J_36260 [Pseudomonas aeruginosa]